MYLLVELWPLTLVASGCPFAMCVNECANGNEPLKRHTNCARYVWYPTNYTKGIHSIERTSVRMALRHKLTVGLVSTAMLIPYIYDTQDYWCGMEKCLIDGRENQMKCVYYSKFRAQLHFMIRIHTVCIFRRMIFRATECRIRIRWSLLWIMAIEWQSIQFHEWHWAILQKCPTKSKSPRNSLDDVTGSIGLVPNRCIANRQINQNKTNCNSRIAYGVWGKKTVKILEMIQMTCVCECVSDCVNTYRRYRICLDLWDLDGMKISADPHRFRWECQQKTFQCQRNQW